MARTVKGLSFYSPFKLTEDSHIKNKIQTGQIDLIQEVFLLPYEELNFIFLSGDIIKPAQTVQERDINLIIVVSK